jgi:hypothetical protein
VAGLVIKPQKQKSPTLVYPEEQDEQLVRLEQTEHCLGQASQFLVMFEPNKRFGQV